ncbi:MAG: hypothetical protein Q8T09_03330 [Candidatus Melainabacteria bacterium]|jgi:hypothetical protein|nr:hypothetical protein [Candidatus Melainabacteria bacterium]
MSLLDGNYIESTHSFEPAWELVLQALAATSQPEFDWQIESDKAAKRIVATMDLGSAFQVKQHLTLELVFSQIGEALRLDMQYAITPMVNIGQSEKLLQETRDEIVKALTTGQELYQAGVIPANEEERPLPESDKQGNDRLLHGIEIVLLLNLVLVLILAMTIKSLQTVIFIAFALQLFWIPIGVFYSLFAGYGKIRDRSSRSFGSVVLFTCGVIWLTLCGTAISVLATIIIFFGLCSAIVGHYQR